jgi:hypothetical protein
MNSNHNLHETRSLQMHRLVAQLYGERPTDVIRFGLENIKRWRQQGVDCDDFVVWEQILLSNPQRLPGILSSSGEEAIRLRQSSPFAGLIPEETRRHILVSTE